ncbi:e1103bd5-5dac-4f39-967c-1bbdf1318431 [Thermothielavioides terrestris]|uniref:E1103bd5-5dac-4f39-967c-1bbdf1318431 n=1 Tax=Thermothielavioides terrestris TaxID=2587410 RepID=A0A446BF13_9PEZI|nr:e1103bd5-5dac-4f39-967c-1bbdf1318431 [Thermothielavioides terrestris]
MKRRLSSIVHAVPQ